MIVVSYVLAALIGFAIGFYVAFTLAGFLCDKWEADDEPDLD